MTTTVGVSSSFLSGDGRPILEPGALFVDGNYALRLNAWCSIAGVTIALRSRFLRSLDGQLVDSGDTLALSSDRSLKTTDVQLPIGFPLNVEVFALAGAPVIGQCFVQVQIVRGDGPATIVLATVLQAYVTTTQAISWPGSPIVNSVDGPGALSLAQGIVPAPTTNAALVVPANARRQIIAARCEFFAAVAAPVRNIGLIASDGTFEYARSMYQANVNSGQAVDCRWMAGFGAQVSPPPIPGGATDANMSLPDPLVLLAGYVLQTVTLNIQAGDQWQGIIAQYREWIDV